MNEWNQYIDANEDVQEIIKEANGGVKRYKYKYDLNL